MRLLSYLREFYLRREVSQERSLYRVRADPHRRCSHENSGGSLAGRFWISLSIFWYFSSIFFEVAIGAPARARGTICITQFSAHHDADRAVRVCF